MSGLVVASSVQLVCYQWPSWPINGQVRGRLMAISVLLVAIIGLLVVISGLLVAFSGL